MALKYTLDSIDDLPEHLQSEYIEQNGKYVLKLEGAPSADSVQRLESALDKVKREKKQLGERLALLGDRKVEDVLAELDRLAELEAGGGGGTDAIERQVKARVAAVERERQALERQFNDLKTELTEHQQRERTRSITDAVRGAISKMDGFARSAEDDALLYAERMFEVDDDGNVVTRAGAGVTPGVDAVVWLTEMQAKKPHWWGPSQGGGAAGNRGGGVVTGNNPWAKATWNLTEQMKMIKENPVRAEQMKRAAKGG